MEKPSGRIFYMGPNCEIVVIIYLVYLPQKFIEHMQQLDFLKKLGNG